MVEEPDAIYLANWDGSSPVLIRTIDSPIPMLALSPDGTELAYFQGNYAYVQDVKTGGVKQLNQDIIGSLGGQLRWSPDGKKIALSCSTPDNPMSSICLIDTDNNSIEILIDQKFLGEVRPFYFMELQDWSRDGSKIVFTYYTPPEKGQKEDFAVYLFDTSSKTIQKVLDSNKQDIITQLMGASISPDNQSLLITGMETNSSFQLFRLDLESRLLSELTRDTTYSHGAPVWGGDSSYFYVNLRQNAIPHENSTAILNTDGDVVSSLDMQGTVIEWIK